MRSKVDFEKLVYEKADVIREADRKKSFYRKTALSAAAAVCVLTVAGAVLNASRMDSAVNSATTRDDEGAAAASLNDVNEMNEAENDGVFAEYGADFYEAENIPDNDISGDFAGSSAGNGIKTENADEEFDGDYEVGYDGIEEKSIHAELITYSPNDGTEKSISDEIAVDAVTKAIESADPVSADTSGKTEIGRMVITYTYDDSGTRSERSVTIYGDCIEVTGEEFYIYDSDNNIADRYVDDVYEVYEMSDEFIDVMRMFVDENFMIER